MTASSSGTEFAVYFEGTGLRSAPGRDIVSPAYRDQAFIDSPTRKVAMLSGSTFSAVLEPLFSHASVPAVFAVVGEHRADPDRLLLLGDDGRYYAYETADGVPIAVELTLDWIVDAA